MLVWYLAAWELPAALLLPVKVRRESSGRIRPRPRALLPLRRPAMRSPPAPVQPRSGPGGARGVPPCRVSHALHPPAPGLCLRPRRRDGRGSCGPGKNHIKEAVLALPDSRAGAGWLCSEAGELGKPQRQLCPSGVARRFAAKGLGAGNWPSPAPT